MSQVLTSLGLNLTITDNFDMLWDKPDVDFVLLAAIVAAGVGIANLGNHPHGLADAHQPCASTRLTSAAISASKSSGGTKPCASTRSSPWRGALAASGRSPS